MDSREAVRNSKRTFKCFTVVYYTYAQIKGFENCTLADFDYVENIPLKEFVVFYYYMGIRPLKVMTIESAEVWSYVNGRISSMVARNYRNLPEPEQLVHHYMVRKIFLMIQSN